MTIRGNWGIDLVEQCTFEVEHLINILEKLENQEIMGNSFNYIIWDELPVGEPESIENE